MIGKLNEKLLHEATDWLAARDPALALVTRQYGYPPLWDREPGFSTLVHIILEQQVSLASANAAFRRLQEALDGSVTPDGLLALPPDCMRTLGFSRQKERYTRALAEATLSGAFRFDQLATLPDHNVREEMKRLQGIGDWTADIYLSECLLRPDILPRGDIAMQEAFRVLHHWPRRPNYDEFLHHTEHWRPWRSVGTRLLWHFYLRERGR